MASYKLSNEADKDLASIFEYSVLNFGYQQATNYLNDMKARLNSLASHEIIGRRADELYAGLRKIESGSHVIYYLLDDNSILVVRILHSSMDSSRHITPLSE